MYHFKQKTVEPVNYKLPYNKKMDYNKCNFTVKSYVKCMEAKSTMVIYGENLHYIYKNSITYSAFLLKLQ